MDRKPLDGEQRCKYGSITIAYSGNETKNEAYLLFKKLDDQAHGEICSPVLLPVKIARLGISEIVITIILATVAKKTLEVILDYIEKYFQERIKKSSHTNVQLIIKFDDSDPGKRFPFRTNNLKPMALKVLFGTIREFISKVYNSKYS